MQPTETSGKPAAKAIVPGVGITPQQAAPAPARTADVRALLDKMVQTGDPEPFKAFLNAHSGSSHSVGGAGSNGIDIPWSTAETILARAGISAADSTLLRPVYERGLRAHFDSKLAEAGRYAERYDIGMMEHVLEEAARHAENAGAVTSIENKIHALKVVHAPAIFDKARASAKEAVANPEVAYKLSSALGYMTTYGALAGMTVAQVEAAKAPFMQSLVTQFKSEVTRFASTPTRGYFRNDIKSRRDSLIEQARRVCANDPKMFATAKAQIIEASRACARVTAYDYLKETDAVVAGQNYIQANIYARMAGLTSFFGLGDSEFKAARRQYIKDVGPSFALSYASWKLINVLNFPRWVSFFT
ncbi:MAG: hypothetical protein ACAI38_20695 [Myxococcota bacterium]